MKEHNLLLDEINKMRATTQASQSIRALSSPSSSSDMSAQDRETLALWIQSLKKELQTEKDNVNKAKMETVKEANDIFDDVLKHRVTKLVNKVDNVWDAYKNIHEANMKYLQI